MANQILESFATSTLTDHPFSSFTANAIGAQYGRNNYGVHFTTSSHHVLIPLLTARKTVFIEWAQNPFGDLFTDIILLVQEGPTTHARVQRNPDGSLYVLFGTGSTVLLATAPGLISPRTYPHLGLRYKVDDAVGEVELRVNGISVGTVSGIDTRNAGVLGEITAARFEGQNTDVADIAIGDDTGAVNNSFLGDISVETSLVTAAGALQEWPTLVGAASQREAVDEQLHNGDIDYIGTTTVGHKSTFQVAGLAGSPSTVKAVQVTAVARKDDPNPSTLALICRNGGVNSLSPDKGISTVHGHLRHSFNEKPGGGAWTPAARATSEIGVEKRA